MNIWDMFKRLRIAGNPDMGICPKCVGTGIDEVGVMMQKEVCTKCDGKGYLHKCPTCEKQIPDRAWCKDCEVCWFCCEAGKTKPTHVSIIFR